MKSIVLYLLGVPIGIIILLNIFQVGAANLQVFHLHAELFFELAGDINKNSNYTNGEQNRGANATYLDINRVLPNGQPNSHYLQAYGDLMVRTNQWDPAVLARFNLTLQALRRTPAAALPVRSEPNVRPH